MFNSTPMVHIWFPGALYVWYVFCNVASFWNYSMGSLHRIISINRLEKLLRCWILMFYIILVQEMVPIFVQRFCRWVVKSSSLTWSDVLPFLFWIISVHSWLFLLQLYIWIGTGFNFLFNLWLYLRLWLQVDPNTGVSMYESDNIIKYLVGKYGVYGYIHLFYVVSYAFFVFTQLYFFV